jgi:plastocyanin
VRAEDATAKVDNFTFVPSPLTVRAGTTVTWRNEDDIPHTVTSASQLFKSKALDTMTVSPSPSLSLAPTTISARCTRA